MQALKTDSEVRGTEMKTNISAFVMTLMLVPGLTTLGYSSQQIQKTDEAQVSQKGILHIDNPVKVGDKTLTPGMYVVQHLKEGQDHVLVFKNLPMDYARQKQIFMPGKDDPGTEVARVNCKVEPVAKKYGRTKLILRTNAAGDKEIAEVQVKGEAFKYLM